MVVEVVVFPEICGVVIDLVADEWKGDIEWLETTYPMKTLESLSVSLAHLSTFVKRLSEDGVVVWGRANRGAHAQKILHDLLGDDGGDVKGVGAILIILGRVLIRGLDLGHGGGCRRELDWLGLLPGWAMELLGLALREHLGPVLARLRLLHVERTDMAMDWKVVVGWHTVRTRSGVHRRLLQKLLARDDGNTPRDLTGTPTSDPGPSSPLPCHLPRAPSPPYLVVHMRPSQA